MRTEPLEKDLLDAYDAYADAIFRHCYYKTSDRELAQDLTQEVFLKAWSYMQAKHPILNMRAFLYRLSDNLVIDWYRKKKSQSLDALTEQGFEPSDDSVRVEEKAEMDENRAKKNVCALGPRKPEETGFLLLFSEERSPRNEAPISGPCLGE